MKKLTRKMEEGVGLKGGKKSEFMDETVLERKKLVETNVKSLKAILKQVNDSKRLWLSVVKKLESYATAMDQPAAARRTSLYSEIEQMYQGMQRAVGDVDMAQFENAIAVVDKYVKECVETTTHDYNSYNDIRMESDMYSEKLKGKLSENKKDENELKFEKTVEVYELRHSSLTKKMDKLIAAAPKMFEMATVCFCGYFNGYFKAIGSHVQKMEKIASDNSSKLTTPFESFGLNPSKTATGDIKSPLSMES